MLLFSFLLLPLMLIWFCCYYKDKKIVPVIAIGIIAGILLCAFKTFFMFSHRVIPYSFSDNFTYFLLKQSMLPVLIVYCLFFAISKDDFQFRVDSYFPLVLSFYSIFLPYLIVSSSEGMYSSFALFVKPLLFAAMLVQTAILAGWIYKSVLVKKYYLTVLFGIVTLGYTVVPSVLEAMYLINEQIPMVFVYSAVYCLIPAGLILLTGLKKIKF